MKHPRNLYLSILREMRKKIEFDYFESDNFEVVSEKNSKYFVMKKLLTRNDIGSVSIKLKKAYNYFLNPNARIFLEGMLYNYSQEEIASLRNFDADLIKYYENFFFDVTDYKNTFFDPVFITAIIEPEIREWYNRCRITPFNEMRYFIDNIEAKKNEADLFEKIKNQSSSNYELYSSYLKAHLKDGFNDSPEIPKKLMQLYRLAIEEQKIAMKAGEVKLRYDDILNKTSSSFLSEWKMVLKQTSVQELTPPKDELEDEELLEQMYKFPSNQIVSDDFLQTSSD